MKSCVRAGSVKRVILTSSITAVSVRPLQGEGHVLDEESWSDVEFLRAYAKQTRAWAYPVSKVLLEKEASKFALDNGISLVTVCPVTTVGKAPATKAHASIPMIVSLLSGDEALIQTLQHSEKANGSTPMVHIDDSSPELLELRARARRSPQKLCVDWSLPELHNCTSRFLIDHHFPTHIARDLQRPGKLSDPLLALWMDPIIPTEPFLQTQVYDLANGGDLIFERDLFALTDFLGRTPPVFYGGQISDNGQLQWLIMANLPGKPESPMFRQIQFSLRENTWVDGLAHALQESLARLCGQNSLAIEGERFAHFARHSSVGLPLSLPYHPVLRHHVDHLDYMLYETRSALSDSRSAANHTQQQLNQYAETIKVIAKERRTLRQLVAKRDATIHRLKTKIAVLKETISTQVEQLQILEGEGEGEDIQGDGYSYVSNDNDYEPEEEGDDDFHQHLPAGMDTTFPLRIDG
ncbi:hypothetical protein QYE76_041957 [Lolium multiflorum]|uniref:Uncharacterized protein n=1 Tax=Lolium multiflorum TaxID=4521 RepID=A0AAD8WUM4_LOLMU|nr:hypothetical protein QYE76_041957 [Lolium multiflorum]